MTIAVPFLWKWCKNFFRLWNITLPLLPPELTFLTRLWRMPLFTALIEWSFAKLVPWAPALGQGEDDYVLSIGQRSVSLFQWLLLAIPLKEEKRIESKHDKISATYFLLPPKHILKLMHILCTWEWGGGEDQKPLDAKRLLSCTGLGLATTSWAPLGTFLSCSLLLVSSICSAAPGICVTFTFCFFVVSSGVSMCCFLPAQEPCQLLLDVLKVQPAAPGPPAGLPVMQAPHIWLWHRHNIRKYVGFPNTYLLKSLLFR